MLDCAGLYIERKDFDRSVVHHNLHALLHGAAPVVEFGSGFREFPDVTDSLTVPYASIWAPVAVVVYVPTLAWSYAFLVESQI